MKKIRRCIIILAVLLALLPSSAVFATLGAPTTLDVKEANCYQSVIEASDMMCLGLTFAGTILITGTEAYIA